MFIFPGIGLGTIVSHASQINDRMFFQAALALSGFVSKDHLAQGQVISRDLSFYFVSYRYFRCFLQFAIFAVCQKLSPLLWPRLQKKTGSRRTTQITGTNPYDLANYLYLFLFAGANPLRNINGRQNIHRW
jgi:hypothetical protein